MEYKVIKITREDLRQYYQTLSKSCKIRMARSNIYNSMPQLIKREFRSKINDLIEIENGVYEIIAEKASKDLQAFLSRFRFCLVD